MTRLPLPIYCLTILALAFASAASCSLEIPGSATGERVLVSFAVCGTVRSGNDGSVVGIHVLSFADGRLDVCEHFNGNTVSVRMLKDRMLNYYVVANAPIDAFSEVKTESDFLSAKCRLEDNAGEVLVMVGSGSGVFTSSESVVVEVSRAVSRVELRSVEPALLSESSFACAGVRILKAYLINVCGSVPYSLVAAEGDFLNRGGFDSGLEGTAVGALLCSEIDRKVDDASAFGTGVMLYACPNTVGDTKLVVEAQIGGVMNYYPVRLPPMKSNCTYIVNRLVLKGFGSADPDSDVVRESVSFEVEVRGWDEENVILNL